MLAERCCSGQGADLEKFLVRSGSVLDRLDRSLVSSLQISLKQKITLFLDGAPTGRTSPLRNWRDSASRTATIMILWSRDRRSWSLSWWRASISAGLEGVEY